MEFHKRAIIYFSNRIAFNLNKKFLSNNLKDKPRLNIYSLHSTRSEYFDEYRDLLSHINEREEFISPLNIDKFIKGEYGNNSVSILTLDDGFQDNYNFAKEVLSLLGIKAVFFIIPYFLLVTSYEKYFHALYPKNNSINNHEMKNIFVSLKIDEIKELINQGHVIGMHGYEHENFNSINKDEISKLVIKGLNIFKENSINIEHFAYPFGNKNSFNNDSNIIISKYFKYIYTGIRGSNYINANINKKKKTAILRRHPISKHNEDLKYYPISIEELNFFSYNNISKVFNIYNNKLDSFI
tara:strand:+ start:115 stop:1005 length:891 start_codon:yes stop_codon:yes gene_type:complete